jgi:hypothetical protein
MGDEKKTGRWAKSLHKAGLIDEVEDSWRLPDNVSITKAKIVVIGEQDGEPPSEAPPDADAIDPADSTDSARQRITECFDVGDYSGCLELAETFLKESPDDEAVTQLVDKCRRVLMQMYESRIGAFDRAPRKAITEEELIWRNLDPLSGFIAATVDGMMTFEDIIDISTVSRFETCRILSQLLQDGIIE